MLDSQNVQSQSKAQTLHCQVFFRPFGPFPFLIKGFPRVLSETALYACEIVGFRPTEICRWTLVPN